MSNNQSVTHTEKFWLNDPSVLFRQNNWHKILPTKSMNKNAVLNSLTRLLIIIAILYIIFSKNKNYVCIFIIAILLIIIIYFLQNNNTQQNIKPENFATVEKDIDVQLPKNNPFGNITMAEILANPIYKQRQFYRMPSNKIPNDQTGFAKWLYQLPNKTCKEDSSSCLMYEDIRYNKVNPELDTSEKKSEDNK